MKWIFLRTLKHEHISNLSIIKGYSWVENNNKFISWELLISLKNGRKIKLKPLNQEMMKINTFNAIQLFKQNFVNGN